jgi:tetratricopeptide (TPR) repeat protein
MISPNRSVHRDKTRSAHHEHVSSAGFCRLRGRRSRHQDTAHRTIVVIDVEGFRDQSRSDSHRAQVRLGLYRALHRAFTRAGVSWDECWREDRGDGVFVLASSEPAKARFSDVLPDALLDALHDHNRGHAPSARIRLRMVLHAGELTYDSFGVTGAAIDHAFRLLEAQALRSVLTGASCPMAVVVSEWFFDEVVRLSPRSRPDTYRQARVTVRETTMRAWIRVPEPPPPEIDLAVLAAVTRSRSTSERTAPLTHLPPGPPVFAGRIPELDQLSNLLAHPRRTTIGIITGTGGIGKTALAVHWARLNVDHFPDGQLYVNLMGFDPTAPPMSAAVAIQRVLTALGVHPGTGPADTGTITARYRDALAGKRMLLILDNVRNSAHVTPLVVRSPACCVLITSRRRLTGVTSHHNAQTIELDYLSETDSRQVLAARIGPARTTAEPGPTGKIIRQCAGLPLALTIVAARAAAQPNMLLSSMSAELDRCLGSLGAQPATDFTSALTAALLSSYQSLEPSAARGFRLLGLLPVADVNVGAATVLTGQSIAETRRLLGDLNATHLVQQYSPERYRMHDLVRLYAAGRINAECTPRQVSEATRRLATYYLSAAHARERLLYPHRQPIRVTVTGFDLAPETGLDDVSALDWFDVELPMLLAIQHIAERHGWDDLVWQLAWCLDGYLWRRGHIHHQLTAWRSGLAAAQRLSDNTVLALAHRLLGQTATRAGLLHEATQHLHHALRVTRDNGDRHGEARSHYDLALAASQQTSYALVHAHEALKLFRALGNAVWTAEALNKIGRLHALSGNPTEARASCEQALALFTQHTNRHGLADALTNLGYIAHIEGHHDHALTHYHNALALYEQVGIRYDQIDTLRQLEQLHRAHGRDAEAERARQRVHALVSTTSG